MLATTGNRWLMVTAMLVLVDGFPASSSALSSSWCVLPSSSSDASQTKSISLLLSTEFFSSPSTSSSMRATPTSSSPSARIATWPNTSSLAPGVSKRTVGASTSTMISAVSDRVSLPAASLKRAYTTRAPSPALSDQTCSPSYATQATPSKLGSLAICISTTPLPSSVADRVRVTWFELVVRAPPLTTTELVPGGSTSRVNWKDSSASIGWPMLLSPPDTRRVCSACGVSAPTVKLPVQVVAVVQVPVTLFWSNGDSAPKVTVGSTAWSISLEKEISKFKPPGPKIPDSSAWPVASSRTTMLFTSGGRWLTVTAMPALVDGFPASSSALSSSWCVLPSSNPDASQAKSISALLSTALTSSPSTNSSMRTTPTLSSAMPRTATWPNSSSLSAGFSKRTVGASTSTMISAVTDAVALPAPSRNRAYTILAPSPDASDQAFSPSNSSQAAPSKLGSLAICIPATPVPTSVASSASVTSLLLVEPIPPSITTDPAWGGAVSSAKVWLTSGSITVPDCAFPSATRTVYSPSPVDPEKVTLPPHWVSELHVPVTASWSNGFSRPTVTASSTV